MSDAFLYGYRKRPPVEFAEVLYQHISPAPPVSISVAPLRQIARSLSIMGVALLVVLAFSPDARAQVRRQVAGVL